MIGGSVGRGAVVQMAAVTIEFVCRRGILELVLAVEAYEVLAVVVVMELVGCCRIVRLPVAITIAAPPGETAEIPPELGPERAWVGRDGVVFEQLLLLSRGSCVDTLGGLDLNV